jgi:hypothetical protein
MKKIDLVLHVCSHILWFKNNNTLYVLNWVYYGYISVIWKRLCFYQSGNSVIRISWNYATSYVLVLWKYFTALEVNSLYVTIASYQSKRWKRSTIGYMYVWYDLKLSKNKKFFTWFWTNHNLLVVIEGLLLREYCRSSYTNSPFLCHYWIIQ